MLKAYKITYKMNPKARKVHVGIQFHTDMEDAQTHSIAYIRQSEPDAVLVSVEVTADPR